MRTSETLTAISPAIVAALAKIEGAEKSAKNEAFKRGNKVSTYATLADAINASRDILADNKLAVMQGVGDLLDGCICVTTRLLHESGEWIEDTAHIPLGKPDAQGAGSAITYARRYGLMAMLNMAAVDDDGNAASEVHDTRVVNPATGRKVDPMSAHQAKKDGRAEAAVKLAHEMTDILEVTELLAWRTSKTAEVETWPPAWQTALWDQYDLHLEELRTIIAREIGADAETGEVGYASGFSMASEHNVQVPNLPNGVR